jgi:beta-lactamase regulating signal transducer with metallopeptidase domain
VILVASNMTALRGEAELAIPEEFQPATPTMPAPTAAAVLPWRSWLALAWLAIAGIAALWIATGLWQTWRLIRRSADAPAWIAGELTTLAGRRAPRVRMSSRLTTAAAVGTIAPRILLPAASACPSQRSLVRAALAHEWAHIRHGDLWLLALERLLLPLLAWQPLFWWLRRSVRLDLELLADAAAAGEQPVEYAEALVAWAKTAGQAPAGLAALSLWESPHTLSRRVTMLLDRSCPPRAGRGWQLLLATLTLVAVAGLSLVSLKPQTAGGQDRLPRNLKATVAADESPQKPAILLQCVVLEADRQVLAEVLPVEDKPQPNPETDISIRTSQEWNAVVEKLATRTTTEVLSRPQIITLDGQSAEVQIVLEVPPQEGSSDADPTKAHPKAGLRLQLTPKLRGENSDRGVSLSLQAERVDLRTGQFKEAIDRKLQAEAIVPLGKTIIVASRPLKAELKPLVMAVEVQLAQQGADNTGGVQSSPRAEDLQRVVQELKRQLDERSREAVAQRDQSEALQRQVQSLQAKLAAITGEGTRVTTVYKLLHTPAQEAATSLRNLLEQVQLLGGDPQLSEVKFMAETNANSVIVTMSPKFQKSIAKIMERIDQPLPRAASSVASRPVPAAAPRPEPEPRPEPQANQEQNVLKALEWLRAHQSDANTGVVSAAQLADRQTQVELLKLDLREAELGLQAARQDQQRTAALRDKGVISQEEIAKHEFQLQAAELKVARVKIMLDGAMRQLIAPQGQNDNHAAPMGATR